jgi:hypothetical protein
MHIGVRGCDRHTINGKISAALMWPLSSCTHVTSPGSDVTVPSRSGQLRRAGPRSAGGARPGGSRPRRRPRTDRATDAARLDRGAILTDIRVIRYDPNRRRSAEPRLDRRAYNAGNAKNPSSARRLDEGRARPSGTPPRTRSLVPARGSAYFHQGTGRLKPRGRQGFDFYLSAKIGISLSGTPGPYDMPRARRKAEWL